MDWQAEAAFLDGRVVVLVGDITQQRVGAIVNAANSTLLGGGGVDGAIHRMGGPEILKECQQIRQTRYPQGLPTGQAVVTTAGNLPARYVIHTVGPIYGRHRERDAQLLADCYENSLTCAAEYQLSSIAFPSISTGAFGYPKEEAAAVSSQAITNWLARNDIVQEVRLVFFQPEDVRLFLHYQIFE
jgi:O-acetyl-ADP-ribose deacetylase (regulator of RNase III)